MKKISILCLLLLSAQMMLVGCKADPEAINNTPEVFADEASDVLRTSAVLTGRIMAPAKASIKEYGFLVSSSSDFTSSDTQTIKCDENLKEFSAQITDLEIGGTYFYAAYATGGLDRMTSTVRAFTTPTRSGVLLSDLRMVDEKSATFSARVADTGGGEINAVGLCWATDDTPTTYDETVITTLNSDNTFTASLTGLEAGKTYYVRAFADSDILGDGTTQTISYSRDVVEIRLEEELPEPEPEPEPIWMLSGSLQGGENEIYFVEDSERGMFVAEDVNLTLWCRFKVYNVEDRGVAYGYADQTRTTHDMVDARLPLDLNGEDIEPTHAGVFDIWFDLDGKYLYIMSDGKTPEEADDYEPKPTGPASNEIWYTSTDGNIVEPYDATGFGANIVSNTYENGQGVILFDGPVASIGDRVFYFCKRLTSVTIGNGVTEIGNEAFEGCIGLTSVTIPDSVTLIGDWGFYCCKGLTSITIPDNVTEIGKQAFGCCTSLTSITIPNSVTSIGRAAFMECAGLTNVTIPDSVTSIGEGAFYNCTSLTAFYGKFASEDNLCLIVDGVLNAFAIACGTTEYTIPNSVTSIGGWGFYLCEGLTSVTIPDSVTSIGDWGFYYCKGLTSITIPDSVTSIGENAFGYCTGLTSVTIPDSVTSIGDWGFYYCKGLTSVTIPDSVTSIGGFAFQDCTNLTSVYCMPTIPPALDILHVNALWNAFENNASDRKIYVPNASVEAYKSASGWSDYADSIYPMNGEESDPETWKIYYTSTDGNIVEPYDVTGFDANIVSNTYENGQGVITFDGPVTSIGDYTFQDCKSLTSIKIPNSVTSIGEGAFERCSSLTSVTIGNGVTSIGNFTFRDCTGLTSVTIPDRVTSIGRSAFMACTSLTAFYGKFATEDNCCLIVYGVLNAFAVGCGATEYTIPDSVKSIGGNAFNRCTGLTSVTIPDSVKSIGVNAFYGCTSLTSIDIPQGVTSIGGSAFSGCTGLTSVTIPDSVTSIEDFTFRDCTGLTSVIIPDSVTSIGGSAFSGCTGLTSITIPYSVTSIGRSAFSNCSGLASVAIPESVTSIGEYAFYNCSSLTSVTIPDSVTSIEGHAFYGCTGLTSITIPDAVTSIEEGTFQNCTGLTSFSIPDSVTEIGRSAFSGCSGLTSVTIPDSVTEIGYSAFEGCTGLTSVTIPDSVISIGGSAFSGCTGLTSITIPDSVTSIEDSAFRKCIGLTTFYGKFASEDNLCLIVDGVLKAFAIGCGATEYTIPDSVTSIGEWAFYRYTSLTSVTIPDSVSSIGDYPFYGCSGLTSVYCKPTTPPTGYSSMFDSNALDRKIYVPNASVDAYKAASGWSSYASSIVGYDF